MEEHEMWREYLVESKESGSVGADVGRDDDGVDPRGHPDARRCAGTLAGAIWCQQQVLHHRRSTIAVMPPRRVSWQVFSEGAGEKDRRDGRGKAQAGASPRGSISISSGHQV